MTSISDHGRNCDSVFDSISSVADTPPKMRPVVLTRLRLQASPISAAAWEFSPAVATITTRSAPLTSLTRSLVRPARSLSQPCMEKPRPGGTPANADAVKKLALFQRRSARCLTTVSLAASSAMTLTCRSLELGASIRNRASAAVDILALSLSIAVQALHRCRGHAWAGHQGVPGGVLEGLVARQHHGRRSHPLVDWIDARRPFALVHERLDGAQQAVARHDDPVIGRHQVLLGAIDDRPHAFLNRGVLHAEALNAAVASARLLGGAIDQIVIVFVGKRTERAGRTFDMDALAVAHRRHFGVGEIADRVVVEAPGPAILVIDRNPEMAVDRMIAARRDHREGRHHPLGDAPVVPVVLGIAPGSDKESARTLDHLEYRPRVGEVVLIALGALEQ